MEFYKILSLRKIQVTRIMCHYKIPDKWSERMIEKQNLIYTYYIYVERKKILEKSSLVTKAVSGNSE